MLDLHRSVIPWFIPINRTYITIPLKKLDADKEHARQKAYDDQHPLQPFQQELHHTIETI
jgi:hypothetical protein